MQYTLEYSQPGGPLVVTCEAIAYSDYAAVEWLLYFENTGVTNTPIIEDVWPLDIKTGYTSPSALDNVLHYSRGSSDSTTDFQPMEIALTPGSGTDLAPNEGRSSDGIMPFFNIEHSDSTGQIVAVGWTGQWQASFDRIRSGELIALAGMEITHFRLYPGERIRTPAILLNFWHGDYRYSQNRFRQLMLDHYTPTPGGNPIDPPVAANVHGTYGDFTSTTEAKMTSFIYNTANRQFPVDYIWIDAGWYDLNGHTTWEWVGTWQPHPTRFPNGMAPVADYAHERGYKFLLWFEPERVTNGSWLMNNHPNWVFTQGLYYWPLLHLGNPDALDWVKNHFSNMISDIGIDIYRHDFNVFPLMAWRNNEAADRQGMNEITHIMGLYEYFDYLLQQHPNLIIDNCASGGRRIDFEMMKRSLPLWRSDHCWDAMAEQCFHYGISDWLPVTGRGTYYLTEYDFRSGMGANFATAFNHNDPGMWAPATSLLNEYLSFRHMYKGDYYPLSPYSTSDATWIAWQFDLPAQGQGMVQAFRRSASATGSMTYKLEGLNTDATYTITNLDGGSGSASGSQLMNTGLQITISSQPGSAVITYSRN